MSGFLFTPMTRFYAEALQYMNNAGSQAADKADGTGSAAAGSAGNAAGTAGTGSFAGTVQEKLAQAAGGTSRVGERNEQAVQAMSMDQYKMYIYQKISGLPTSATQKWDAA